MHKVKSVLENEMHKIHSDFEIQTDLLIPVKRRKLMIINQKKRTCRIMDFAIPADHRVKIKESKMRDKYIGLARELRKLFSMKVTMIPIVIGVLRTVPKGLERRLEARRI